MSENNGLEIPLSHPLSQSDRPGLRTKPKGGAPKGNRNAWKTGAFGAASIAKRQALWAEIRPFLRETRQLCAIANRRFAEMQAGERATLRRKGARDRD